MIIQFEADVDDATIEHLKAHFSLQDDDAVCDMVKAHVNAALAEYHDLFCGRKVFRRGSDLLEYRLVLLIKHQFGGTIPDEHIVGGMFQMSGNESRSIIRAVISKYQHQLSDSLEKTIRGVLESATQSPNAGTYSVIIRNRSIVDAINQRLANIDPALSPIEKQRHSASTYIIQPSAFQRLNNF
jgi:hypothetical protein